MTHFNSKRLVTARKPHWCRTCGRRIAPGTRYLRCAGTSVEGDFMYWKSHTDCADLWSAMFADWGCLDDGMDLDLCEVLAGQGCKSEAMDALNHHRGHFPHAVCRIEFRLRNWLEPKGGDDNV